MVIYIKFINTDIDIDEGRTHNPTNNMKRTYPTNGNSRLE
jgi:hypothetical protein